MLLRIGSELSFKIQTLLIVAEPESESWFSCAKSPKIWRVDPADMIAISEH